MVVVRIVEVAEGKKAMLWAHQMGVRPGDRSSGRVSRRRSEQSLIAMGNCEALWTRAVHWRGSGVPVLPIS